MIPRNCLLNTMAEMLDETPESERLFFSAWCNGLCATERAEPVAPIADGCYSVDNIMGFARRLSDESLSEVFFRVFRWYRRSLLCVGEVDYDMIFSEAINAKPFKTPQEIATPRDRKIRWTTEQTRQEGYYRAVYRALVNDNSERVFQDAHTGEYHAVCISDTGWPLVLVRDGIERDVESLGINDLFHISKRYSEESFVAEIMEKHADKSVPAIT